jgi:hypothetical protein
MYSPRVWLYPVFPRALRVKEFRYDLGHHMDSRITQS